MFDGNDVAAVDIGGHEVPGDGVLALAGEQGPRRDVQSRVLGQWSVVEVDRDRRAVEQALGQHAEVGDAEQHVEVERIEHSSHIARRMDDRDAERPRMVTDLRVIGHHDHDVEPVLPRKVYAVAHQ